MSDTTTSAETLISRSAQSTVATLFAQQVRRGGERIALADRARKVSYRELFERVKRLAGVLEAHGIKAGDRVAILSENRLEFPEIVLACAMTGAILACQNWRLSVTELRHCLGLVEPSLVLVSERPIERAIRVKARRRGVKSRPQGVKLQQQRVKSRLQGVKLQPRSGSLGSWGACWETWRTN